jgi:5-oxoprolinase (ATP-hydrolysing)
MTSKFRFAIDRGGTFTDCFCLTPTNKVVTLKLLSKNPLMYDDAPTYAIKKIIAEETGMPIDTQQLIDTELIEWVRMGTTVATNALLESKGERFCLLITEGFKDLLYIGNQSRPNLFDLSIQMPKVLNEYVIEVEERVTPVIKEFSNLTEEERENIKVLDNQQMIQIVKELNLIKLESDLKEMLTKYEINNIAVLLMHSYLYNDHEIKIEKLAKRLGIKSISLSHRF